MLLGHHGTSRTTRRRQRDVAQPTIGPYMPTEVLHAPQRATRSAAHGPQHRRAERTVTIAHLFSWTVLTRPKNEVITFFLLCLASIDATLTAIVGDRLLPYWYSTIAAGGICVPTSKRTHEQSSQSTCVYCQFLFYL